jgi:hypothetical protein
MIGTVYEAVQIEDVSFQPIELPSADVGRSERPDIEAPYVQEGLEPVVDDLFRCTPGAALLVPPLPAVAQGDYKLCIAFRPVVRRADAQAERKAA